MKSIAVPEKHAASLRAKQLDMVRRITFIMVLANIVNAGIVVICFHATTASDLLYVWSAAVLAASTVLSAPSSSIRMTWTRWRRVRKMRSTILRALHF